MLELTVLMVGAVLLFAFGVRKISRWGCLETRYRHRARFQNPTRLLWYGSRMMKDHQWFQSKNALRVGVSEQGLYIRPVLLLRIFMRPVLVPWEAMAVRKEHLGLGFQEVQFLFHSPAGMGISIPEKLYTKLCRKSGLQAW